MALCLASQAGCSSDLTHDTLLADCTFADFEATQIIWVTDEAQLSLAVCQVDNNFILSKPSALFGAAIIIADSRCSRTDVQVRLQNCVFEEHARSEGPALLADNRGASKQALFYSDSISPSVCTFNGPSAKSPKTCDGTAPQEPLLLAAAGGGFVSASDAWVLKTLQVRPLFYSQHV